VITKKKRRNDIDATSLNEPTAFLLVAGSEHPRLDGAGDGDSAFVMAPITTMPITRTKVCVRADNSANCDCECELDATSPSKVYGFNESTESESLFVWETWSQIECTPVENHT